MSLIFPTNLRLFTARFLLIMLFFSFSRLLFLIYHADAFLSEGFFSLILAFFAGLRFDLSIVAYLNLPFLLFHLIPYPVTKQKTVQIGLVALMTVVNAFALFWNYVDKAYFPFSGKRSGAEIFEMQAEAAPMMGAYFRDFWDLTLLFLLQLPLLFILLQKIIHFKWVNTQKQPNIGAYLVFSLVIGGLSFLAMRGGLQKKPLKPIDSVRISSPQLSSLVVNTPFKILRTWNKKALAKVDYFDNEEAKKALFQPKRQYLEPPQYVFDATGETMRDIPEPENVVLIILESFGQEYIGFFNNGEGYTPFLDGLLAKSLVAPNAYANGKKSIEALPAILSAMPSWMETPYSNSIYQNNRVESIGKILQEEGYHTSFFHGGKNGTMDFDSYILMSESGAYFGMDEYPDAAADYDGQWGIFDEPYLQYFCEKLTSFPRPFFSSVFTLSSHHPYRIPEAYKDRFQGGPLAIHASVQYADHALARFFECAKSQDWYDNTLFVITADHTAENHLNSYNHLVGKYKIPIAFYHPGKTLLGESSATTQQIDLMPSILDYLGVETPFFAFGKSIFDKKAAPWALQYDNGTHQFIYDQSVIHFHDDEVVDYSHKKPHPEGGYELVHKDEVVPEKQIQLLKAILQTYYESLSGNKTYVEKEQDNE